MATKMLPKTTSLNLGSMLRLKILSPNKCLTVMRLVRPGKKCLPEPTSLKEKVLPGHKEYEGQANSVVVGEC